MRQNINLLIKYKFIVILVFFLGVIHYSGYCIEDIGNEETHIIIYHINDVHAEINNFPKFAWKVAEEKNKIKNVFFFNIGDNFSGDPLLDDAEPKGEPLRLIMNQMGYSAMELGNHEFDYGQPILANFMKLANFPIIAANIQIIQSDNPDAIPQPKPYIILTTDNGLKIACLGLIEVEEGKNIPSTDENLVKNITFSEPIKTALQYKYLKAENNVLVALTHIGEKSDDILAQKMGEIDVIVGGHSHTPIKESKQINGVLISQACPDGDCLGRIELIFKNGHLISKKGELIKPTEIGGEMPDIAAIIKKFNDERPDLKKILIKLPFSMKKTQIAMFMADAIRKQCNLDIGFHNPAGVRKEQADEDITVQEMKEMYPFRNQIRIFEMKPKQIRKFIEKNYLICKRIDVIPSGIRYTIFFSKNKKGESIVKKITIKTMNGNPLNEKRKYKLGISDYVAKKYKKYLVNPIVSDETELQDIFIRYLTNIDVNTFCEALKEERMNQIEIK